MTKNTLFGKNLPFYTLTKKTIDFSVIHVKIVLAYIIIPDYREILWL